MKNTLIPIITIDGPASSGKGTVARLIASKLGFHYLESGAIYRVLALLVIRNKIDKDNESKIEDLVKHMNLRFTTGEILLDGIDVKAEIRAEEVGMLASYIAKSSIVRKALLAFQREFAVAPGLVTDGRDMGSVVFPNASLKVFLTASANARAKRRFLQLQKTGESATIATILRDIKARDKQDRERDASPLCYDSTFRVLDNSDYTIHETVSLVLDWFSHCKKE